MGKKILRFIVILLGTLATQLHAQTTAALTVDGDAGPITVCAGSIIEILATIDPPSATYPYQWVKETPLYTDLTTQSGTGDLFSSIRVQVTESSVFLVRVPGGGEDRITINVEDPPNPGLSTSIFLCNKSGNLNLFDELGGTPETGGTWTDSSGTPIAGGTFVVGTSSANEVYTYTLIPPASSPCGPINASVTVRECSNDDYDNDGVNNVIDLDDDNDGILDTVEEGCATKVPTNFSIKENFGFGTIPSQNPYVVPTLTFNSIFPDDTTGSGEYTVANSAHFLTPIAPFDAIFVATDLNDDEDADGESNGRYLAINMLTAVFINQPVYIQQDLPVTPGIEHTFTLSYSNTNNNPGEVQPSLAIQLLRADGSIIDEEITGEIPSNQDEWEIILKTFIPNPGDEFVTLQIVNLQTSSGNGNDFAIDNIYLYTEQCDFDLDGVPNSRDLDSDNDGIYDVVEAGATDADNDGRADGAVDANGIPSSAGAGLIPIATTAGTNDYLNLDSDADGCSDANEAYFDPEADGGDTGVYGIDTFDFTTIVDFDGLIRTAPYTPPVDQDGNTTSDYQEIGPDTNANSTPDACEVVTRAYICSSETTFDLNTVLLPVIPNTGTWSPGLPTGIINPSTITPFDTDTSYTYSYTESSIAKTVSIFIQIIEAPNPGISTTIFLASDDPSTDLITALGTGVTTGGSWENPSAAAFGTDDHGTFDPTSDVFGIYTYIVTSGTATTAACTTTATVEVVESNTTFICSSETSFDLNTILPVGTATGGTWSPTPVSGIIDPGTLTPLNTEITYSYTIAGGSTPIEVVISISEAPTLALDGNASCATDKLTFSQAFTTNNPSWITLNPPTAGTISGNTISGIPSNTSFEIMATNPANTNCVATLIVLARDCSCPDLDEPTNPNNPTICEDDTIPALSVTIPPGLIGRWYFEDRTTPIPGQDNTDTYTPDSASITAGVNTFYVEGYSTSDLCPSDQIPVTLTVVAPPEIVIPTTTSGCDQFVLETLNIGDYYDAPGGPTGTGTMLSEGNSITTSQTLYIYAESTVNSISCSAEVSFPITVNTSPTPTPPNPGIQCGSYILPALGAGQQYFSASNGTGNEFFGGNTLTTSQTIYLVETNPTSGCLGEANFDVTIEEIVTPDLGANQFICIATDGTPIDNEFPIILSGLDAAIYTFGWAFNGDTLVSENGTSIFATLPGTYTLIATSLTGCTSNIGTTEIIGVTGPTSLTLVNSGDLITNNSITATATGNGIFEYSLDQGAYQSSPIFNDVALGYHEVSVRDINGCNAIFEEIFIIGFPNFFTPNEDGYNDNWNVISDNSLPDMTISIFDRYGKLLKTITSLSNGWDGKYNGQDLPATDYWFLAISEDQQEYRSHFALIR